MSEKSYHCLYHHSHCFFVRKVEKNLSGYKTLVSLCVYGLWMRVVRSSWTYGCSARLDRGNVNTWARIRDFFQVCGGRGNFRPLSHFCCFTYTYMMGYVYIYVGCACLLDLVWFHHIKLSFWIYPGDFYMSLPRAVFSVFPGCWLALMLKLTCVSESCERSVWMESVNLVGRVVLF